MGSREGLNLHTGIGNVIWFNKIVILGRLKGHMMIFGVDFGDFCVLKLIFGRVCNFFIHFRPIERGG